MMSISPPSGQRPAGAADSIQIAGQVPVPQGSLTLTSKKPYVHSAWPRVMSLAEE